MALWAVLVLALGLRLWGIRFGLPNLFHPDEWAIVDPAMMMLKTGDFNPHDFHYPTFFIYNEAIVFVLRFFYGVARGQFDNINNLPIIGMYTWGRIFAALYGTAAVFIVYKAGTRLFNKTAGLSAALFMAVVFLHVRDSHYIAVDIPATTLAALSLLFAVNVLLFDRQKDYALAGLAAGLATATKWNTAPILICLLAAHLINYARREPINSRLGIGLGFFICGLFIGTPYAWLDPKDFFATVGPVFAHYSTGHAGFEALSPTWYYVSHIGSIEGASLPIAALAIIGFLLSLYRDTLKSAFLAVLPMIYLLLFAGSKVTFPRAVLPLYPFIAIFAGYALSVVFNWAIGRWGLDKVYILKAVIVMAAIAISIPSLIRSAQYGIGSTDVSTRTQAGAWIDQNIDHRAKLAAEFYAPPTSDDFDIIELAHIDEFKPSWFLSEKFDYIIFDSADYQRYFDDPRRYKKQVNAYKSLFALGEFIKIFPADPRVELFLSPEIKILKIEKTKKSETQE